MLLSPNMKVSPDMRRFSSETQGIHRGPFGWLDNHLLSARRLPAGYTMGTNVLRPSNGFIKPALEREITLARLSTCLVNGFDEWSPDLGFNLHLNQIQSVSIEGL